MGRAKNKTKIKMGAGVSCRGTIPDNVLTFWLHVHYTIIVVRCQYMQRRAPLCDKTMTPYYFLGNRSVIIGLAGKLIS